MSKPIKILRVANVIDNRHGGMSRTMYVTGDYLGEMGFEVSYLFSEQFRWKLHNGLKRYTLPWETAVILRRLRREGKKYDLVELHEPLAFGHGLLRLIGGDRSKLIAFSYGLEDRGRMAMINYRRSHGIPMPLKGRVTSKVHAWQSVFGLSLCDHVVCSNQSDLEYLSERGIPRERLTRHFSGADEKLLAAGAGALSKKRSDLLFLGNWLDRKGIFDLIPAVTQVLRKHPQTKFTVAGCQLQREAICAYFAADVHGQINVVPWLASDDELSALYASHAIFVLPSYFEGQPLVMLEAAAFGLAIVTTPVCGMLDFISDGANGVFVPVGNPVKLAEALDHLVSAPDQAQKLGTEARQSALQQTWKQSAANLAQAYTRLARV